MADAFTKTASVNWDQAAWNRLLYFAFRENYVADQFADVKPTAQTNPGATVTFFIANDLTPVSTALDESTDVDAVALSDSTVTVNLYEYGEAVIETELLRLTSMIATDPAIANILGSNAAESMDLLAFSALKVGTNVDYSGAATSRGTVTPATVISTADFRYAANRLRRARVPKRGGIYQAVLHPDAVYDLQSETGELGWNSSHIYTESGVQRIMNGSVGVYRGFDVLETTNAPIFADAGSSPATTDVYRSLFFGAQALAKGYSNADGYGPMPVTVKSPVVDKLERFQAWGWKHFVGYKLFRQAAVYAIESGSSIGANS
jgi:N4-gp56 family major capsid protein